LASLTQGSSTTSRPRNVATRLLDWLASHGDYIFVLVAFILLTILFTWPLATNFTTYANGSVMDVFHEIWYLHLDVTLPYGPFFIFSTNTILYPYGVPMYFQVVSPLHGLIAIPIAHFFGLIAAYNFVYMFTFFASCFTMYIFVNYLTHNKYAAFFAGIAFGFAPVHTGQGIAHINIMASEMLPLYGYFLVKMFREQKMRNAIYAGVLVVLNAMLDLHFLLMASIITVGFLFYWLIAQRRSILNKPFITRFIVMVCVAGFLGILVYFQTVYGLIFAPNSVGTATAASVAAHTGRSPDLLQFFIPPPTNPVFGQYTTAIYTNFLSFPEVQTYIGYSVLAMSIVGLIANRRDKNVWLYGFLAALGFILSLGPNIIINGNVTALQGPWAYIYYLVPLFRSFRTPYRIDYVVIFGLSVLSGYGVSAIMSAWDKQHLNFKAISALKLLTITLLCLILIIEFLPIPYTMLNLQIPSFYTQVLANDHSNYTVLEVPAYEGNDVYLYYQTAYNHPLINGHISRTPPSSLITVESAPFIDQLGTYVKGRPVHTDIINQTINPIQIAPYILAEYNIKYIIVHKDLLPTTTYNSIMHTLTSALGIPYYEDNLLTVFRYIPPSPTFGLADYPAENNVSFVATLFGGWNQVGLINGHARTMDFYAGLNVYSSTNQYMQFEFKVEGITGNYQLQTLINGQSIATYFVGNGTYTTISTPFVYVHQGVNQLVFNSLEGCKTISVGGTTTSPPIEACASVQFSWIAPIPATTSLQNSTVFIDP
jgi:hypothetical protein